jgi:hypothetical protein
MIKIRVGLTGFYILPPLFLDIDITLFEANGIEAMHEILGLIQFTKTPEARSFLPMQHRHC